jgi:Gpi18-like mannosyltransferase
MIRYLPMLLYQYFCGTNMYDTSKNTSTMASLSALVPTFLLQVELQHSTDARIVIFYPNLALTMEHGDGASTLFVR